MGLWQCTCPSRYDRSIAPYLGCRLASELSNRILGFELSTFTEFASWCRIQIFFCQLIITGRSLWKNTNGNNVKTAASCCQNLNNRELFMVSWLCYWRNFEKCLYTLICKGSTWKQNVQESCMPCIATPHKHKNSCPLLEQYFIQIFNPISIFHSLVTLLSHLYLELLSPFIILLFSRRRVLCTVEPQFDDPFRKRSPQYYELYSIFIEYQYQYQ